MDGPLSRTPQFELQLTHVPVAFSGVLQAIEELAGKKFPEGEGVEKELYVHRLQSKKERAKELRDKHSQIKKERLTKYQVGNHQHHQACQSDQARLKSGRAGKQTREPRRLYPRYGGMTQSVPDLRLLICFTGS